MHYHAFCPIWLASFFSPPSKSSSCGLLHRPVRRRHGWALPVSRWAGRLKAPSGEVSGSNSRIGLEDSPGVCCHAPACECSACHQYWGGGAGRSISKSDCTQRILRSRQKRLGWAFPPPLSHFPFTLFQAPGEYSPSCQCNVAHRGNHAASLASGLPAWRRKCNFST